MPLLKIQTNQTIESPADSALLSSASKAVSKILGKPEDYVMVSLESNTSMLFAGSDAPLAYLELKSLGLAEERTAEYSKALCELMESELSIPQDRIYIEFCNGQRHGWSGRTF